VGWGGCLAPLSPQITISNFNKFLFLYPLLCSLPLSSSPPIYHRCINKQGKKTMNRRQFIATTATAMLCGGCSTLPLLWEKPELIAPKGEYAFCKGAMNEAARLLATKGTKTKHTHTVEVVVTKGVKKVGGIWSFYVDAYPGMTIGGLISRSSGKYRILVAGHPVTGKELSAKVLVHEFGHFWLMSNYGDSSHNPKYKDLFYNWKSPYAASIMSHGPQNDDIHVDFLYE
jgi:hypothetical protein